jgi:hypothetical protein
MCTVSVNVNEATVRGLNPRLDSPAAIRQWAQQQIDLCIQQMEMERERNVPQEDLWRAIEQDKNLTLKPSEISADHAETIDIETFRTDLHRMVEEIYAEQ